MSVCRASHRDPPDSAGSGPGLQAFAAVTGFPCRLWGPKSAPRACEPTISPHSIWERNKVQTGGKYHDEKQLTSHEYVLSEWFISALYHTEHTLASGLLLTLITGKEKPAQ